MGGTVCPQRGVPGRRPLRPLLQRGDLESPLSQAGAQAPARGSCTCHKNRRRSISQPHRYYSINGFDTKSSLVEPTWEGV
jgi:hypothetical protein